MFDSINPRVLNQASAAVRFTELASVQTGLHSIFGDPAKYPLVGNDIKSAQSATSRCLKKIEALVSDETRPSAPQKHEAGATVVKQTTGTIAAAKAKIVETADALLASADDDINRFFRPNPDRAGIESEIRGLIRETAKGENGLFEIRKMMEEDVEFANVIAHSPYKLLGIPKSVQQTMKMEAVEKHLPDVYKRAESANELYDLAPKFDRAITGVRSLVLDSVADLVATRVSVDD